MQIDFIGNNLAQDKARKEAKLKLNSLYGQMISCYCDTDSIGKVYKSADTHAERRWQLDKDNPGYRV